MATEGFNINGKDGFDSVIVFVSDINFDDETFKKTGHGFDGGILTSTCGDSIIDSRDGKKYGTVLIGEQCWMSQNMDVGTMISARSATQPPTNNRTIEKYCYGNDPSKCDVYGGLYLWDEAMQGVTTEGAQGVCPDGWHIPTDAECTTLTDYLGGESVAGGKMKSTGTIGLGTGLWYTPNTEATNETGFTGLPSGTRVYPSGPFDYLGYYGYSWTSTEHSNLSHAWTRTLSYNYGTVYTTYNDKTYGFPVRCLKDD